MDVRPNVRAGKVLTFVGVLMLVLGLFQGGAGADKSTAPGQVKKQSAPPAQVGGTSTNAGTDCGSYCSTTDGTPSANGGGNGNATGQPCAGCVGNADNKNPPGQYKDGSDHNNGYECDGNNGIAKGNPAHSTCKATTTTTPQQQTTTTVPQTTTTLQTTTTVPQTTTTIASTTTTVGGPTTTTADVLGVQYTKDVEAARALASTGAGFFRPFMLLGALMLLVGVALMTIKLSPQAKA